MGASQSAEKTAESSTSTPAEPQVCNRQYAQGQIMASSSVESLETICASLGKITGRHHSLLHPLVH